MRVGPGPRPRPELMDKLSYYIPVDDRDLAVRPSGNVDEEAAKAGADAASAEADADAGAADLVVARAVLGKMGIPDDVVAALAEGELRTEAAWHREWLDGRRTYAEAVEHYRTAFGGRRRPIAYGAGAPSNDGGGAAGRACGRLDAVAIAALRRDPGEVCEGQIITAGDGASYRVIRSSVSGAFVTELVDGAGPCMGGMVRTGDGTCGRPADPGPPGPDAAAQAQRAAMARGVVVGAVGAAAALGLVWAAMYYSRAASRKSKQAE